MSGRRTRNQGWGEVVPEAVAKSVSRAQRVASGTGLPCSSGESECIYVTFASRPCLPRPPPDPSAVALQIFCKAAAAVRLGLAAAAALKKRAQTTLVAAAPTANFYLDSEFLENNLHVIKRTLSIIRIRNGDDLSE